MTNFKEELKKVKAFAFDVDGVLASPEVYLHPNGELMRSMNTKDGYALQHTVKRGYPIAIITGGKTDSVGDRFRGLALQIYTWAPPLKLTILMIIYLNITSRQKMYFTWVMICPIMKC